MTHPCQRAIDMLMKVCDGARAKDGQGFSKADVSLIHYDGAPADVLDSSELAQRLIKYHRQIGDDITAQLKQLADSNKTGAESTSTAGTVFAEEGHLKLYVHKNIKSFKVDSALRKAGVLKKRHDDGFVFINKPQRVLHLAAAGVRVSDRTLAWCASQVGV